jgi:hypothetical protein
MPRVRALPLALLAACAATPPESGFSGSGTLPYRSSHELAWQALSRVSARDAASETLRVDSATWEIRCGSRFRCEARPGSGVVSVDFNGDLDWYLAFAARFHETLAKLQQARGT